jgi:hypothetical protein
VPVVGARVAGQAILRLVEEQSGLHLDALVEQLTNASAVDTIYALIAVGGWPERALPNCAKPIDACAIMVADPSAVDRATWLLWVAHNLERSADGHLLTRRGVRN